MHKLKEKKSSFSDSINFLVVLCFGIAFLIIFITSIILLILNGEADHSFYLKAIFMFVAFLVIYIASSLLVVIKIRKMFRPLDKLAHGLLTEEIRVYGDSDDIRKLADNLKADMRKLEDITKELDDTKMNLDQVQSKALMEQSSVENGLEKYDSYLVEIEKSREHLKTDFRKESRILEELPLLQAGMKQSRKTILNSQNSLQEGFRSSEQALEDTREELKQTEEAFGLLNQMLVENSEDIESLFSEMTYLQSIASKINLTCSNLSLELARQGALQASVSNIMEDLKDTADKMNEKTDAMAMFLIRARNAAKLAQDQSEYCKEQMQQGQENFEITENNMEEMKGTADHLQLAMEKLGKDLEHFTGHLSSLQKIMVSKNKELAYMEQQQMQLKKLHRGMQKEIFHET